MPPVVSPPLVIARAGVLLGPESPLEAIRAALATGADAIRVDVGSDSDGVPILLPNNAAGQPTDGQESLTLREAIEEVRGRALLDIEIREDGIEGEVAEAVRSLNAAGDAWISSARAETLDACKWIAPEIPRSLVFDGVGGDPSSFMLYALSTLLLASFAPKASYIEKNPAFVELCQKRGVPCYTWAVDDPPLMQRMIDIEVDGIITNDPRAARLLIHPEVAASLEPVEETQATTAHV